MHHGTLCAQSESFYVEPSQTNHICARSTENITVLSHNTVSDVALPVKRSQLTQRQRKRIRDNKRKHKFYSNAYKLKDKVAEQEDLLADADQKVTALTVQQQLYKRYAVLRGACGLQFIEHDLHRDCACIIHLLDAIYY